MPAEQEVGTVDDIQPCSPVDSTYMALTYTTCTCLLLPSGLTFHDKISNVESLKHIKSISNAAVSRHCYLHFLANEMLLGSCPFGMGEFLYGEQIVYHACCQCSASQSRLCATTFRPNVFGVRPYRSKTRSVSPKIGLTRCPFGPAAGKINSGLWASHE